MPDYSSIAHNLEQCRTRIPEGVTLVGVSKFHPAEAVLEAYNAGLRHFGENRVQEIVAKAPALPPDIKWHFIGHLQTNKVRKLIGIPYLIESVDSEKLLRIIDDESRRAGVTSRVLMQVHVAREETKFGFSPDELIGFFSKRAFESLTNTHICGIMGMASNTDDSDRVSADFRLIAATFAQIKQVAPDLRGFDTVSMGMSHDFPLAIAEGSTEVRIGTAIFGQREY